MKEARRVAILVCIVLLCSIQGCDTYEFGDQAKDFVEKEAYGYSKRLAEADLKSRWPNFFVSALVETGLSLDAVSHNLVNVEALVDHSPKFDERAAVTQLIFYDRSMPVLRENQQRIEQALAKTKLLASICDNREAFDALHIRLLALVGPLESLNIPNLDWHIYIGFSGSTDSQPGTNNQPSGSNGYFWSTVADSVASLFNASIYEHQMDLFHEALAEYPQKVVQDAELFSMSKQICEQSFKAQGDNLKTIAEELENYQGLNLKIEAALNVLHKTDEAYLSPQRIKNSMQAHGVLQVFDKWQREVFSGRITRDLAIAMTEITELQSTAKSTNDCLGALTASDELSDAIAEDEAVLKALQPAIVDEELRQRIQNRLGKIQFAAAVRNSEILPKLKSSCKSIGPPTEEIRHRESTDEAATLQRINIDYAAVQKTRQQVVPFLLNGPLYGKDHDPEALCAKLKSLGSTAICQSSPLLTKPTEKLCAYGDFCIDTFPALAATRTSQAAVLVAISQQGLQTQASISSPYFNFPAQTQYLVTYVGPDLGPPSNVRTALGASAFVLGNILNDGGYGTGARKTADELNAFRKNIDDRIQGLITRGGLQAQIVQTFTPQFSATLADHKAFIDGQAPLLDSSLASVKETERRVLAEVANRPVAGSAPEETIIAGLSQQATLQSAQNNIPLHNIRPSGSSIGGLTDEVRNKSFSSGNATKRDIEREARRAKAVFNSPNDVRYKYEMDAARAYAVGRLKTALMLTEAGQAGAARRYIEDAWSARYFAQGMIGGVVNFVTDDGNNEQLSFTNDPHTMAGSLWVAVLTGDELDRDAELGDFGLPYLTVTFDSVPQSLAVRAGRVNAPELPNNESVDDNIRTAIFSLHVEAAFDQDPGILTGRTMSVRELLWFRNQVHPFGPWDYKRVDQTYDYAGNFNYGATGAALGLTLQQLWIAAGMEKVRNRGLNPANGTPWGAWPYGNEPDKQRAIEDGFIYYMQHKEYWDRLRFPKKTDPR